MPLRHTNPIGCQKKSQPAEISMTVRGVPFGPEQPMILKCPNTSAIFCP
jgi:hypothetical protein